MILYQEDIARSAPYIHLETKNTSAIRICHILKQMGVHNWYFPLALHQSELKNVDPFDPSLSIEMKQKILLESKINIWYFIREISRIPSAGGEAIHFEFNRGNLAFIWSFFNDIDIGFVCMRQIGKTTTTCAIMSWIMAVGAENVTIGFCSKDGTNTSDAVRRLKDMLHELPPYFVPKTTSDIDRKESLSIGARHNFYITFTPANDEAGAYKIGRKQETAAC